EREASMGPRSSTAESAERSADVACIASPLQWGRGHRPRKALEDAAVLVREHRASMGPRSSTAESLLVANVALLAWIGFNGAAVIDRGKQALATGLTSKDTASMGPRSSTAESW